VNPAVLLPRVSDYFSFLCAEIVGRKGRGEEGEARLKGTLESKVVVLLIYYGR